MDEVTQQNAALVEEAAAAAASLREQAAHLVDVVGIFKTGERRQLASDRTGTFVPKITPVLKFPQKTHLPAKPAASRRAAPKIANAKSNDDWVEF